MPSEFPTHPSRPLTFSSQRRGPSSTSSGKHGAREHRWAEIITTDVRISSHGGRMFESVRLSSFPSVRNSCTPDNRSSQTFIHRRSILQRDALTQDMSLIVCYRPRVRTPRTSLWGWVLSSQPQGVSASIDAEHKAIVNQGIATHDRLRDNKQHFYGLAHATPANDGH